MSTIHIVMPISDEMAVMSLSSREQHHDVYNILSAVIKLTPLSVPLLDINNLGYLKHSLDNNTSVLRKALITLCTHYAV
jgi:hypothetical protein